MITVTLLNEFELGNALRFAEFKKFIPDGSADLFWNEYQQDRDAGRIRPASCNLADLVSRASKLSEEWTLQHGHRSFDILHIAGACICEAKRFLTFDQNQIDLVRRVGISPCPEA
ncbi:MAG: hypothetical protein WD708_01885 [Kiritimatiellia bacterium]